MARTQRWHSKNLVKAAMNNLDVACNQFSNAMEPYRDRFPDKGKAIDAVFVSIEVIKDCMKTVLIDV